MAMQTGTFTDAQRMELRSYVQLAGEAFAAYWPMRTFIHHNPLHGLEEMPFEQAVRRGADLLGGRGYLPNEAYRHYFQLGRIRAEHLIEALAPLATDQHVVFGGRTTSHLELLTASMVHGVMERDIGGSTGTPSDDTLREVTEGVGLLLDASVFMAPEPLLPWAAHELPVRETLSTWCDRTLGTDLVTRINEQMIKWCSVFLDEGEASWSMPGRERTFYRAWKALASHDLNLWLIGVTDGAHKIAELSDRPEDAVLDSLRVLRIPKSAWQEYLTWHLAALPGWTGFIKWRSAESHYPWQEQYPIDLVKYLAVRLFYERELVDQACRKSLGLAGHYEALHEFMSLTPHAFWLRRGWNAGCLAESALREVRKLRRTRDAAAWEELATRLYAQALQTRSQDAVHTAGRRLLKLADAFGLPATSIVTTSPSDLRTILQWLASFPASQHGQRWLAAFELSHRDAVIQQLRDGMTNRTHSESPEPRPGPSRPLAQLVFCIDVRSEVFRWHLENLGGYATFGLAGFFGIPLEYRAFGAEQSVTHCPVLLKPKNHIREIPRSYHEKTAERHRLAAQFSKAGHTLLHDLKQNVITPYVMVEALGWFFSLPLFGKTFCPLWYHRVTQWLKRLFVPPLATTLTIDKLTRAEAEEMVASEQRAYIREMLREELHLRGAAVTPALLETLRLQALEPTNPRKGGHVGKALGILPAEEEALYERLQRELTMTPRGISARLDRITQNGFSIAEQAYGVEAGLRLMGLTEGFARLVVFCGHGSTSENNPYESALDCGACGGNHGLPNARAFAAMANRPAVRDLLQARGITIPSDTHFVAAHHDTTCDELRIVDLEDVPATHRKDLSRLRADLDEAGAHAARDRGVALEGLTAAHRAGFAQRRAKRRSADWAQVRPEWGLSRNSLFIVGRRELTRTLNLEGRAFLHSYDFRQDDSGRLLETIMTAPLVVAQWINMEHYFSTVDNEIYGSGSKIYHNVVARVGVMSGVSSDLRIGLPAQTVLDGPRPYHEPMRLLAVIEAPRERIQAIILKHPLLDRLCNCRWVSLVALDPKDEMFYGYEGTTGWTPLQGGTHGGTNAASHERD
jgi:uncharacterized protein YbcC (UPF0753/DUF2309 family)